MNNDIIKNNYYKYSKYVNIKSLKIRGILDLKDFTKIEVLDCSFNKLTSIINCPLTLEELYCNFNLLN